LLASLVDEACSRPPLHRHFALADQMRRAAISILSNIAEGFEYGTSPTFRRFLAVAKGSAAELQAQIYLCEDRQYLDHETTRCLRSHADNVSRMLWGLLRHLDRSLAR
jgi:four helix bundle protein